MQHRPLLWLRPPAIARDDVEQLWVEEDRSLTVNDQTVLRCALKVRTRSGKRHTLAILAAIEQAHCVEREIERAFGVADVAMLHEVPTRQR